MLDREMKQDPGRFCAMGRTMCDVHTPRLVECLFSGEVMVSRISGKTGKKEMLFKKKNTIQTALLNATPKGVADGTFLAINKMEFLDALSATLATETVTKQAGGTGVEDYVTFRATYSNSSGSSKTVATLQLGYDLTGGSERIDSIADITDTVVPDGDSLQVDWKITFSLASGDIVGIYRFHVIKMIADGTFYPPDKIRFASTEPANYDVAASKEEGGTGAEAYVQYVGTFTATLTITIDTVGLLYSTGPYIYVYSDITNKTLASGEQLIAHIKITHASV